MKDLLFGRSGETRETLSRFHYFMRYLYTWANVVLVHGGSWRGYREQWMR